MANLSYKTVGHTEDKLEAWFRDHLANHVTALEGKPAFGGRVTFKVKKLKAPINEISAQDYLRKHCKVSDRHVTVIPVLRNSNPCFVFGSLSD